MILLDFLIILILILINGMFVAAEFAIIGVRKTRIDQLADNGHKTAQRVQYILKSPAQVDRYIASAQLGITIASLGLGMYGEPVIAHLIEPPLHDWFGLEGDIVHTISFLFALGLITYLHVVLGEMVPKSMALQSAERVVFALSRPMALMQAVFSLPITILNNIGMGVLWVLRVPSPDADSRFHTADELELIISDSVVGGMIEENEEQLIQNIFDFSSLTAERVMTPRPKINSVSVDIEKDDLLKTIFSSVHTRLPIYEGDIDHIIGIVHLKDLVHHHLDNAPFNLRDLLHEVPFVPEGMPADDLLTMFKTRHIHMAIVIDEYGGTAGLVTMEDLIEEVVGEVRDEFDADERDHVTVIKAGHLAVLGSTRLDELEDYLDVSQFETDDIVTVGGLMVANMQIPLQEGDQTTLHGVTFHASEVDGLTIEKVDIHYPPPTLATPPDADSATS